MDRMIADGELPNLGAMARTGARAQLTVTEPIMSPILWTTMASGYPADVHGIGGWTTGRGHAYSGADVQVLRVWDVLGAAGGQSVVSGWLMTWPASPVRGVLLSEKFVWSFPMNKDPSEASAQAPPPRLSGTAFPDALAARADGLRPDAAWLASHRLAYQLETYGAPFHPLVRDETHLRVFEAEWRRAPEARFGAVYLNAADQVSHLYWPFVDPAVSAELRRDPSLRDAAVSAAQVPGRRPLPYADGLDADALADAARWVPDVYRTLDDAVGRVRAAVGPDVTLVVVSDHGFRASSAQPFLNGSHDGTSTLLAAGPRVRAGARADAHVFDVAPTLYTLLDLPAGKDMPGRVLTELFDVEEQPRVPTRRVPRGTVTVDAASAAGSMDDLADRQLREQLEALGYIDENGRPASQPGASRGVRAR